MSITLIVKHSTEYKYTIYENVVYRIPYIVYNDTYTMINGKYTIHIYDYTIHTQYTIIVSSFSRCTVQSFINFFMHLLIYVQSST